MIGWFRARAGDGASSAPPSALPAVGLSGPVPWMVAVMTALAMLGLAAAIGLTPAATALSGQIAGRASIQILDTDPLLRRDTVARVRTMLRDAPYVGRVETVPEEQLQALASQWLGDGTPQSGITLPALIDVDLVSANAGDGMDRLRADVRSISESARVTAHADWLGPVAGLLRVLGWTAAVIALLLVAIAASVAVLAARSALAAQRASIDVLHLVGATDVQITRMFQKQIARDMVAGAGVGGLAGLALLGVIGWQLQSVQSALASGSGWAAYLLVIVVPPMIVAIALLSARVAVLRALRVMP
jgi:cell division transport system permease protein